MQFRVLQLAYFDNQLVQPGDVVTSEEDLSTALAPANQAKPEELSPIYERVPDGDVP